MKITVGVAAHVDAGKTTFSEGLLYHTNTIREMGRVDHQNSYLDTHQIEKERGITIFAEQAVINYQGDTYYLIDTPGHVDFSAEMERAIMVMDYGIIIVSAVEGVQGHTETVWHLFKKHKIPVFFFINKVDRVGADVDRVLEEISLNLTEDILYINNSIASHDLEQEHIEYLAESDDELLELYFEGKYDKDLWVEMIRKRIEENSLSICASGSALQDEGVIEFFDNFHLLTKKKAKSVANDFKARIFKIRHDEKGNRMSHMKILDGSLKVRDEITYKIGDKELSEKVTQLRIYNGNKYRNVETASRGDLIAVMGLSETGAGQALGNLNQDSAYKMVPTLKSKVIFDSSLNVKEVLAAFNILNEEDPALKVSWQEELQEIQISVMGPIQLEILKEIVKERFDYNVDFDEPGIIYKETIRGKVRGYGHFEPLKHYAEVHLEIEEGPRGSGIVFENLAHVDNLSKGNQNLIKQHIYEKEHKGLLTGNSLTDLKISLLTGAAHNKHTHGGDFREATYRALWQGLEKAEKLLLEPYYAFKIKVELDDMGRVLADIQRANGSFKPPESSGEKTIIRGKAPVATFMNYPTELMAFTGGKGMINLYFSGYDLCHNSEEVIEKIAYDKEADREYSSSSVFCSHGKGYIVPWYEAEGKMHC
ncbi:MAG: GTP-binding protein, partial [Halanaerobiaceae bacterium]